MLKRYLLFSALLFAFLHTEAQISIDEKKQYLKFAEAFTPNNDGKNDTWFPVLELSVDSFQVKIFNRWGELFAVINDKQPFWDGKNKKGKIISGQYLYSAEIYLQGQKKLQSGILMLITN